MICLSYLLLWANEMWLTHKQSQPSFFLVTDYNQSLVQTYNISDFYLKLVQ